MSILVTFIAATLSQAFAAEKTIVVGFSYDGASAQVTYLCRGPGRGEITRTSGRAALNDEQKAQLGHDMLAKAATACSGLDWDAAPTVAAKANVPGQVQCSTQGRAMGQIWAKSLQSLADVFATAPGSDRLTGSGGLRTQGGGCGGTDEEFQTGFYEGAVAVSLAKLTTAELASEGSPETPENNEEPTDVVLQEDRLSLSAAGSPRKTSRTEFDH